MVKTDPTSTWQSRRRNAIEAESGLDAQAPSKWALVPSMSEIPPALLPHTAVRGSQGGRVRRLQGFVKGRHREPDGHFAATEAFVRKIGEPDVAERVEELYRRLRVAFGWKRRELASAVEGGLGRVETPAFTVHAWVEQDPAVARAFLLKVEVNAIRDAAALGDPAFAEVFAGFCDTVVIALPQEVDVALQIDALEDLPTLGGELDYPADATWLTLSSGGPLPVTMRVEAHEISFRHAPGGHLRDLLAGMRSLVAEFGTAGGWRALDGS